MNEYPTSIVPSEIDAMHIAPAVVRAARRFASSRPWRGSIEERKAKFRNATQEICAAAGIALPRLVFAVDERTDSSRSCFIPAMNTIILRGRLSVVTLLHEIGHARHGSSEHMAVYWSLALFRAAFPRSFAKLRFRGHMAVTQRQGRTAR